MNALPAGSLEYSATTSSAAWSICPSSATQHALLTEDFPRWPCLRARQFKDHGPGDPLDPATTLPRSDERCRCSQVIRPGVGYEVPQILFRLMKPVFETTYGVQPTPMLRLPQHRLLHQTHDSGIHTLNPHTCNPRPLKTGKRKKPEVTYPFEFVTSGGAVCSTALDAHPLQPHAPVLTFLDPTKIWVLLCGQRLLRRERFQRALEDNDNQELTTPAPLEDQ